MRTDHLSPAALATVLGVFVCAGVSRRHVEHYVTGQLGGLEPAPDGVKQVVLTRMVTVSCLCFKKA